MSRTCPLCKSDLVREVDVYRGNTKLYTGLKRCLCQTCCLQFAHPMPDNELLISYNKSYFENAHGGTHLSPPHSAFLSAISKLRIDYIQSYLKTHQIKVRNVLEIGPGTGYLARNWILKNPDHMYYAVESDETLHSSLSEMGVKLVNLSRFDYESIGGIDLVIISHVLEHVADPVLFLRQATKCLRLEGVVFIEVPCRDFEHKELDEPHLLFFDKKSLRILFGLLNFENITANYYGSKIHDILRNRFLKKFYFRIRNKLIKHNFVLPFSQNERGLESLDPGLEKAVIKPFSAHLESSEPAAWLRAIAQKF